MLLFFLYFSQITCSDVCQLTSILGKAKTETKTKFKSETRTSLPTTFYRRVRRARVWSVSIAFHCPGT